MKKRRLLLLCVFLVLLAGCRTPVSEGATPLPRLPTPTTHPLFNPEIGTEISKTQTAVIPAPTFTPIPDTPVPEATIPVPTATPDLSGIDILTVYGDEMSADWSLSTNPGMDSKLQDATYAHTGIYSLSISPKEENSNILFRVRSDAAHQFPREKVLALRFWIYTINDYIRFDDLTLTVLGSNTYPYWVRNDTSLSEEVSTYSGKRVYGFNLSEPVPLNTWVQIEVDLDDLVYDPNFDEEPVEDPGYEFLTGFYLNYVSGLWETVFIDDIEILVLKEES